MADHSWNGNEHNLLFESLGNGQFADVARPLGCDNADDSRGVAIADLDGDGRLDFVVANNADPPTIYLNRLRATGNWLRLDIRGGQGNGVNRDALGARVTIAFVQDGRQRQLTRWVEAGSGYASQSDMRLHFGLAGVQKINWLEITWPNGEKERMEGDEIKELINCEVQIVCGEGMNQIRTNATTKSVATVVPFVNEKLD